MVELVWDAERSGTIVTRSGATARVGDESAFSPDDLLAMSASACLMRTFLADAARDHLPVLSYASTATVERVGDGLLTIAIHAYVMTASAEQRERLISLFEHSRCRSEICGLLGDRMMAHVDVRVLPALPPQG